MESKMSIRHIPEYERKEIAERRAYMEQHYTEFNLIYDFCSYEDTDLPCSQCPYEFICRTGRAYNP
jgi:hypothetical protein